ncbi:type II secretion system F family protein [Lentisphaerota bacterium ZTH]|nr:type II secretion system F family protein [Lentisphaerota bacterium]WET06859.1 type II secretion system F family protein [Lentisphaerota bacterium ZTH]
MTGGNFSTLTFAAALCAGISATCILLLLQLLLEKVQVEKKLDNELKKALPLMLRIVMPLAPNARFIARMPFMMNKTRKTSEQLLMAGYSDIVSAEDFIAARTLLILLGLIFWLMASLYGHPMLGLVMLMALHFYPGAWLKKTVKNRHNSILRALPNVLDLLTLSVEAGKDFLTSLRDILARRKIDALGEELNRTFREIQLGKKRSQALRDMSQRVRQPDLTSVLNAVIQAEELGVSIGQLLRIQGETLRNKRFSRAEKLANEAPVKILGPVVIFIFPAVLIILMVPILMQAARFLGR